MTEQNEPTLEQLQAIESELGAMLVDYFADRGIPPAVGVSVLTSLVGKGLHAYSAPEDRERSLELVFRSIRYLVEGGQTATIGH